MITVKDNNDEEWLKRSLEGAFNKYFVDHIFFVDDSPHIALHEAYEYLTLSSASIMHVKDNTSQ